VLLPTETLVRARRPGITAACAVLLVLLLAAGCGLDDSPADLSPTLASGHALPQRGGHLVVGIPAESNGWNPFINQWTDSGTMVGTSMIEPLVVQENDGKVVPWLAESWVPGNNFTQWTITIRPGVLFHDGTPLTAQVVQQNLDASLKSGFHQIVKSLYVRSEVLDPLTLRVHLRDPWAQYPASLANEWMMSPHMLEREDGGVTDPVGTGPFVFVSWDQRKVLKARRYDRYWRKDPAGESLPYVDEVEFRPIPDDRLREQELRGGTVDLALSNAAGVATAVGENFTVIKDYSTQRTYLVLNTQVGETNAGNPFVNVHARRALAYATDRTKIAKLAGEDVQSTTFGFRHDSPWAPDGPDGYVAYDPDQARVEIEKYKKETGAKTLTFSVLTLASGESQTMVQALKASWEAVGIKATITGVDAAKQTILTALGSYQAAWFRFFDFPDPDQVNFYFNSVNIKPVGGISMNFPHYSSRTLDDNYKILRESVDPGARKAASDAVIRETNEQVLSLWLYDTPESLVGAAQVRGLDSFRTHALANNLPKPWLAEVWLAR
jgi:ABC-type transport system substrate-binding protein